MARADGEGKGVPPFAILNAIIRFLIEKEIPFENSNLCQNFSF